MTKRFTINKKGGVFYLFDNGNLIPIYDGQPICDLLNELHEENQELKFANKELIRFITSKGYTLKDYIKFIGQFQSVGVNKKDWVIKGVKGELYSCKADVFEMTYEKVEE